MTDVNNGGGSGGVSGSSSSSSSSRHIDKAMIANSVILMLVKIKLESLKTC